MKTEKWTFEIETHDALQNEMVHELLGFLDSYLQKRGGRCLVLKCEFPEDSILHAGVKNA